MSDILRTENLAVGYGTRRVLEEICLHAEQRRILTLIGPNGAGKSTLLKTLIHQLPAVDGAIFLDGRPLAGMKEREIALCSAAVLTARPDPELMRCVDVVSAGRYPHTGRFGILTQNDRRAVWEAMALVGVEALAETDFARVSDGQRQRVLLARALCQEPRLLLMDEPTSFLDLRHKLDFLTLLRRLAREKGIAVVLSLHELELAQKFSDRVLCIKNGRVDRFGTPEDIFSGDYIAALYDLEAGRFDARFGSVEPQPTTGAPRVFVIGGGGGGIPVYRALHRLGLPFAAGVLSENDVETPVALALAAQVVTETAFEPVSRERVEAALAVLKTCEAAVCCLERFGTQNAANRALLNYARERGMLKTVEELEQEQSDRRGGYQPPV